VTAPTTRPGSGTAGVPLLEVRDLQVGVPGRDGPLALVHGLSFAVDAGRTLGIVGESGSGKSMTSLAIMGLLPPGATASGSVRLRTQRHPEGEELLSAGAGRLRGLRGDRMAMIFQDPLSCLNPYYRVGVQVAEAHRVHRGSSRRQARALAVDVLGRVGIPRPHQRVDDYPYQFSGGMRQRIMIAMSLVCEPDLLIADEPTTALDVTVQAQILALLSDLQREFGTGMIYITHDLAVVSQVAEDILVLREGRPVEHGPAEQIFSDPQQDYTRELLDAVPRIDDPVPAPHLQGGTTPLRPPGTSWGGGTP